MSNIICGCVPSKLDGTEHQFSIENAPVLPESVFYKNVLPKVIDQGETSICVPCSISASVNWYINTENNTMGADAHVNLLDIYAQRACKDTEGMTIKEALHYGYKEGFKIAGGIRKVNEYSMVGNANDLRLALILNGPCIGALPVYETPGNDFWNQFPGHDKFLGGHAISIAGYNKDGFIIRNSWGRQYAQDGYVLLPYSDIGKFYEVWTVS